MDNAENIAAWVHSAHVENYKQDDNDIFIARKGNAHFILICQRVEYENMKRKYPHFDLIWVENGQSTLLYQTIVGKNGQEKYSTSNMIGQHTARENIETIWASLLAKLKKQEAT